jgi:hypothetical protein
MHIRNHPHTLPAIIHPSLNNNNNINGTGQIGLHKMSLLSPGTRDGEIQTLGITNSSMQYQCLRTHTRSILQTCNNYCQVLPHLHYSSYCLVLLHLPCHPFHKTRSSLRIHHDLPFLPAQPIPNLNHRPPLPLHNADFQNYPSYNINPISIQEVQLRSGRVLNKNQPKTKIASKVIIEEHEDETADNLSPEIPLQDVIIPKQKESESQPNTQP